MAAATGAGQPDAARSETTTDQDTVAYARDLVDHLDGLNHLAADIDHTCTPRWWPHKVGETCCCDICGHRWHVENYPQGQLGWTSDA